MINLIAALSEKTRAIGKNGELLFTVPEDLKRFKDLTNGHPVIMGRKTWESLPERFRPLPGRTNIVVTRDTSYSAPGADVVHSFEEAVTFGEMQEGGAELWVIGGGELYTLALPRADKLYLTLFDSDEDGDAHFPDYSDFTLEEENERQTTENGLAYRFATFGRPSSNDD